MWKKINKQWFPLKKQYDSTSFKSKLVGSELFQPSLNDDNAVIYTHALSLDDVFEEHRNHCNSADKLNDENGFWIVGWFDSTKVIENKFNNRYSVHYASTDTYKYDSALQRSSVDYKDLTQTYSTLEIDGTDVLDGSRILLKNQAYETLTAYTFTRVGTKGVKITDTTPATKYKYFTENNEVVFVDGSNNSVLYDKVKDLKSIVEWNGSQYVNYVTFNTENTIPDTATKVADRVDGLYTVTDVYQQNGIYKYTNGSLVRDTDLSVATQRINYLVWVTEGTTNKDKHFYLKRKADGTYPTPDTDKVEFGLGNIHVVGHNLAYSLNKTEPLYASYPYKFLILDHELANKLDTVDMDGRVDAAKKDAYGRVNAIPVTFSSFNTNDTLDDILSFSSSYNSVDNVLKKEIDETFSAATVKPHLQFKSIKGQTNDKRYWDYNDYFETFPIVNLNELRLGNSTISFEASAGDLVYVRVYNNTTYQVYLEETFVVQDYDKFADTATYNILNIFPALSSEFVTEMEAIDDTDDVFIEVYNTSLYTGLANVVDLFPKTFLSKYYDVKANGNDLVISFADTDYAKYAYLETVVTYKTIGNNLASPTPSMYGYRYSIETLLANVDSVFDSSFAFSNTELPEHTYTYHNVEGSTRFGILGNKIYFGNSFTVDYKKHTWVSLSYTGTTDFKVFILDIQEVGDETHVIIDYNFDVNNPDSEPVPDEGYTVTMNSVRNLFDISDLLKERSQLRQYRAGQNAYAQVMLRDNDFRDNVTGILWRNEQGVVQVALSKDTAATTGSDDIRRYFEPCEIHRVGSDGKEATTILLSETDWFEGDDDKIVISPSTESSKRIRFIDGLSEDKIRNNIDGQGYYAWILAPDVLAVNAVVGREINNTSPSNQSRLVWYKGEWRNGTWKNGVWLSGSWKKGVWEGGEWYSYYVVDNGNTMNVIKTNTKDEFSIWYNGTWLSGIWHSGTWKSGNFISGTWKDGIFEDGTWTNGTWFNGIFQKGVWLNGYWFGGDFETGEWYNGTWDDSVSVVSRFGTKATMDNRAIWYGGNWNGGEFHSGYNSLNNVTLPSLDHRCSIWWNGTWNSGTFWGGTFVFGAWKNGTFEDGVWLGGYPVSAITWISDSVKQLTLNITRYDSILDLDSPSSKHPLYIAQVISLIGNAETSTNLSASLANERIENNLSELKFTVSAIAPTTINVNWTGTSSEVSSTTWVAENSGTKTPSGLPFVASVWENGIWKKGIWLHGLFASGEFRTGIFANGLFTAGTIGSTDDTFVAIKNLPN